MKADQKPGGGIQQSQYVAHLGSHHTFTRQMNNLIDSYGPLGKRLVFVCDGAPWIRNWIKAAFPKAVSILDYYHALQYLYEFAEFHFKKDRQKAHQWVEGQKALLLAGRLPKVMDNIHTLAPELPHSRKVLDYYRTNQDRMDYKKYRQMGCGIIGSGAIESAHRTVVQKRLKLSGQRWTKQGAQHMLNLRVTHMNGQWNQVVNLVKTEFKAAA